MKNSKEQRAYVFFYCVTLILVELVTVSISLSNLESGVLNMLLMVISILLTAVAHFVMCLVVGFVIHNAKNKKFSEEYSPIMDEYGRTDDAQKMLEGLLGMSVVPKTDTARNAYNFSLSTAYFKTGNMEQAKAALLRVDSKDINIIEEVKKQLTMIEQNL